MKIKDLLTDESKWVKGHSATDKEGYAVNPIGENAVCWCLIGAMEKCYGRNNALELLRVSIKIVEKIQTNAITTWNDDSKRKFSDIKKLLEELDI